MEEVDWKERLTPEQYRVMREKATEAPFTGSFLHNEREGVYTCVACHEPLFSSTAKFDSGSGWPSFYDVAKTGAITLIPDMSHGMVRTEVVCTKCGGHLGHLFEDALDQPTGMRYCINSVALYFKAGSS
jgi:peptide-methionine (R)-S-oxide reductase